MAHPSSFLSRVVAQEIRRIVVNGRSNGRVVSAPEAAALVLATYPRCGLDEADVANEVMMAAAREGVAVEIGRPGDAPYNFK